ncbi:MAG TPA: Yip1 family protein [Casimicrobiaceae bacterium]|nr:Yip1 family protein [Casimicrobiaceae bacterium]
MNLIDRVKNILLQPKVEWPKIATESATPQSIYLGYIVILVAIAPLAILLRTGGAGLVAAVVHYVIALAVTFLLALIVDALAPTFGGEKNFVQSLKLVAYSYTAAWIAGVFLLIPVLGGIIALLAAIYSWYTFYLGVPVLKKCPQDKAVGYTIVVVICGILLGIVLAGFLVSLVVGGGMMGMGAGMFN